MRIKNNILILGRGLIAQRLQKAFKCNLLDRSINSFNGVNREIKKYNPKIIVNCIDRTGNTADDCELDKDGTLRDNTFFPIMLAEVALRNKIKLIHIGSGCIFHFDYKKDKPITEDKTPDFFDLFYSRSKIYSETILGLLASKFDILIVRIRIPLDGQPHPKNILTKLIQYKKVINIPNSVTYIPDFIKALGHLIKVNARGIYNVVNAGSLFYPDLMEIYKKYNPAFNYKIIDYKELNLTRTNIILSTKKLEKSGFKIRNINAVLNECVKSYVKY